MPDISKGTANRYPNAPVQGGMSEALRLTREGRLSEATALIQDALGNPLGTSPGNTYTPGVDPEEGYRTQTGSTVARSIALPGAAGGRRPGGRANPSGAARARVRAPGASPGVSSGAGRFVTGSFANQAGTRAYKLYVSSGVAGGTTTEPLPLVVMLHGCTQNADDLAAGTGMNALAESGEFLVVYPEQAASANPSRCWNWFKTGDQQRERGEPSIIAGITRQVAATHPVDTRRIYVAGMSAGGAMAVVMASTYPDLYAAAGVHSGLAYGAAHDMPSAFRAMKQGAPDPARAKTRAAGAVDLSRAVPTIVFHGDRDGTVHRRNAEQILGRWATPEAVSGRDRSGVPPVKVRRGQVPGGRAYTRSVYHDADGNPVAEGWSVHGAGHAWAGGSPEGSYTDPSGPDASAEMVRFFLEHPRA